MKCPICGSFQLQKMEVLTVCHGCISARSDYHFDASIYGHEYYMEYLRRGLSVKGFQLEMMRLSFMVPYLQRHSIVLDYGCGPGFFIRACNRNQIGAFGVEVNPYCLTAGVTEKIPEGISFDCITLWDVIEHFENPFDALKLFHSEFIALSTPNFSVIYPRLNEIKSWRHYKPKEHLWYFSLNSLDIIFNSISYKRIFKSFDESRIREGLGEENILTVVYQKC